MTQLVLNISDNSKLSALLNFLKTLNYVDVHETKSIITLSLNQVEELENRIASRDLNNYKTWEETKKDLVYKTK